MGLNDFPHAVQVCDGNGNPIGSTAGALKVDAVFSGSNPSVGTPGASVPVSATYIAGDFGGNLTPLSVDASGALNITGSITASNPSVSATGAAVPAQATYLGFRDAVGNLVGLTLTLGNELPVFFSNTSIDATQSGPWTISGISGPIALPTGAATSALQGTGNVSLATLVTRTPSLGQNTMAGSSPVVIASDQSAIPISGSVTASGTVAVSNFPATQPVSGTVSVSSLPSIPAGVNAIGSVTVTSTVLPANAAQETGGNLATIASRTPALGQATMANSAPVVIASNQTAVPVSGTVTATVAGIPSISGAIAASKTTTGTATLYTAPANSYAIINVYVSNVGDANDITLSIGGQIAGVWNGPSGSGFSSPGMLNGFLTTSGPYYVGPGQAVSATLTATVAGNEIRISGVQFTNT